MLTLPPSSMILSHDCNGHGCEVRLGDYSTNGLDVVNQQSVVVSKSHEVNAFLITDKSNLPPQQTTYIRSGYFEVMKMKYVDTGIIAIGDLIAGLAMVLWVVLLVSPAVAMAVVIVGQKWNNLNKKRIGAELEMLNKLRHDEGGTHHSLANWLRIKGIPAKTAAYNSESTRDYTKVQPDTSVEGNGFEIVSPVMYNDEMKEWYSQLFKSLSGITASSISAGYHVHVGLKDLHSHWGEGGQMTWQTAQSIGGRVAWAFGYFERNAWDMLVSPSRRHGQGMSVSMGSLDYVTRNFKHENIGRIEEDYFDEADNVWRSRMTEVTDETKDKWFANVYGHYSGDRYQKLNLRSLNKHGTIEFRQHQCINADGIKAERWANLCFDFVNRCVGTDNLDDITSYSNDLQGMFDWLGFAKSDSQRLYWTTRSRMLNNERLAQPCSTCGSHRCMLDNNCPQTDKISTLQANNWSQYVAESKPQYEPSYYDNCMCIACNAEVEFNFLRDNSGFDNIEHYDDHVALTTYDDCEDITGNDCSCNQWHLYHQYGFALGLALMFPIMSAVVLLVGCGIGAVHAAGKAFNAKAKFKKLWVNLVNRGSQASGFAYEAGDGVMYLKAAESSVGLAHNMNKYINKHVKWGLCHTRFATRGDKDDDNNAHPHFDSTGTVTLVHNGTVENYLEAWTQLNESQTGEVDSMVIAQAVYEGGIEKVVELCEGAMSLIWSDARDPTGTLKCWTNGGNPLHMGRLDDKDNGAVVIASTVNHLKDTFGKRLKTDWAAYIGREYTIHPDGSITKRDIEGSADTYSALNHRAWWTYGTTNKAYGTADNCRISTTTTEQHRNRDKDTHLGIGETDHVHDLKDKVMDEWGGWPAFDDLVKGALYQYHGYDILAHEGIRPNGTRYELPQYFDSNYWEDCDDLMMGRLDESKVYDDYWLTKYDDKYHMQWYDW